MTCTHTHMNRTPVFKKYMDGCLFNINKWIVHKLKQRLHFARVKGSGSQMRPLESFISETVFSSNKKTKDNLAVRDNFDFLFVCLISSVYSWYLSMILKERGVSKRQVFKSCWSFGIQTAECKLNT